MSDTTPISQQSSYWKAQLDPEFKAIKERYDGYEPHEVKLLDPEAYTLLYEQPDVSAEGIEDTNWATDFAGNLLWKTGEGWSFGALTAADMWRDGAWSERMGVRDWEDNSWAGRLGGIIGEGLGFIAPVGKIGQGLKGAAGAVGFGTKPLARAGSDKIRSETAEALSKITGEIDDDINKEFADNLYKAGVNSLKTAKEEAVSKFGRRKAGKMDPLADFDIRTNVHKNFDDALTDALKTNEKFAGNGTIQGLLNNKQLRDELRETSLRTAREYSSENIPRVLAIRAQQLGLSATQSQYAGDMAFEAALLGIHGGMRNIVEKQAKEYWEIDDPNYGTRSFVSDVWHGLYTGAALARIRYIKGGAKVEVDPGAILSGRMPKAKAGVMANISQASRAVTRKLFNRKATDYTPKQLQTMLRNIYYGSNRNTEFFRSIEGWTPKLVEDVGMLANKNNVKALQRAYNAVQKDVTTNLAPMLMRESARDLYESFWRYTIGSVAMNASHWKNDWANLTGDELVTQYLVGAFYMKRGKTLDGKPPAKRFITDSDIKGNEIARMSQSFDAMGWSKKTLNEYGATWDKLYQDHFLASKLAIKSNEGSPEIRSINTLLEKDRVSSSEFQTQLTKPGIRDWTTWSAVEYTRLLELAKQNRDQGNNTEAKKLELEATDLLRRSEIARTIVDDLSFGINDRVIRGMDKKSALEFIDTLNNMEINGKKPTIDNISQEITKARKAATYQTTGEIQTVLENYIKNSLDSFGLWDRSMETDGIIRVHPDTIDLLLTKLSKMPQVDKYSDAVMTLKDVLITADKIGVISLDSRSLSWGAADAKQMQLDRMLSEYTVNTERMHDLIMNTKNSGWRDVIPFKQTTSQFLDNHILSSPPIWEAIKTNMLHVRNDIGMQILTGKGSAGTESIQFLNEELNTRYFKGAKRLELEGGKEAFDKITDQPHLINLLNNINAAWGVTEGMKNRLPYTDITVNELKALHESTQRHVGNLFTDSNNFNAFKNYLSNEYVNTLLGDAVSYGAKRAITDLVTEGNPLSFTIGDKRVIASSKAIIDNILGSEYGNSMIALDPNFATEVRRLGERYSKEIENVVKDKGGFIEFSNEINIGERSVITPKDWMKALTKVETLLDGSKVFEVSKVYENIFKLESLSSSFSTAAHYEKLADVAMERLSVQDLKTALDNLRINTRELTSLFTDAIQNNDYILLRSIVDKQYDIDRAMNQAKQFTTEGKGTLEGVTQTIKRVTLEALNERNRKLALDSVESVDEFIKRQEEIVTRKDSSGKPKTESQTIGESQFIARYGTEQAFVDLIKGDMVSASNAVGETARIMKAFFEKNPALKDLPEMSDVFNNIENLKISPEYYMKEIVKPLVEAEFVRSKAINKEIAYDQYMSDISQLLVSSWAQTKVPVGNYENGRVRISQKSVTNWDAGFLGLINSLGLANKPSSYMLFGETSIAGNRVVTKLSPDMINEINSKLALGASLKMSRSDLLSAKENAELERLLKDFGVQVGEGQDGRPQFQVFRLDEKQAILLSTSTYKDIIQTWRNEGSELRQNLNKALGKEKADKFLKDRLKLEEFELGKIDKQAYSTEVIEGLLLTTRLLKDNNLLLDKWVNNEMGREEVFKALKYLKLSNPRGGITLNKTTLDIMRYFTKEIMPNTPEYADMKRHFESQMNRPQKQITIYDEKGPGENFFNSDTHTRQILKKQFVQEAGMSEAKALEKANEIADKLKSESKSIVDGEIYLTLPEMTALLTARGADKRWFVWEGDQIVGFNTVIKPVVSHNKINKDGSIDVVIDKTAYKYDPTMDAAMRNADGTYFADALAFKSASKTNATRKKGETEWTDNIIGLTLPKDVTKPWKPQIASELQSQRGKAGSDLKIVEIDRANMMLKSISGPHDGTLSMAFGNFLTNGAQGTMSSWLGSGKVIADVNRHMADLYRNPFAYSAVAKELSKYNKEVGDITSQMTGLEAIIAEGGIPIFEHIRPQIERALVGNYLGARNFASGHIKNGSYNVMTAGDLLSLPVREGGIQIRLGGSGIPHVEASKNIRELLAYPTNTESVSLVFTITKEKAADLNTLFNTNKLLKNQEKLDIFTAGDNIVVTGNKNLISGPFEGILNKNSYNIYGDAKGLKSVEINRKAAALQAVQELLYKDYIDIMDRAKGDMIGNEPTVNTLGDLVRFLDGNQLTPQQKLNSDFYNRDYTITNGERSEARKLGHQSVRVVDNNLRTPKDGINSWVLTGIEKLIDARKGAVSEMNAKDLINPQDADFDLDKSASFFATPSTIVKEIHNVSGYHETSSSMLWDKASYELSMESSELQGYVGKLQQLEGARPTIVRQHSLTSLLYQFFGALDGVSIRNKLEPGYKYGVEIDPISKEVNAMGESMGGVNIISDFVGNNYQRYQVEFKHGAEFVDAVGYMKKVIKETIDIYGDLAPLQSQNMIDKFWFSENVGMLKINEVGKDGTRTPVEWNSAKTDAKVEAVQAKILQNVINPMNKIFNLGLGYETLSNGTTRKLGFYDHVRIFDKAKHDIAQLMQPKDMGGTPELASFAKDFLGFLGENPGKAGTSKHPLIEGLKEIQQMHNNNFKLRIERNDELGNILASAPTTDMAQKVQKAVRKYMENERNYARFQTLQWEVNQLENILSDMSSRRQHETTQFKDLTNRKNMLLEALTEVETIFNDRIIQSYNPKTKDGSMPEADAVYKIYRKGEPIATVPKGAPLFWKKGDIVVQNPRTFRFSDPIQQKHLRTMDRAFGNQLPGVEMFDIRDPRGYIRTVTDKLKLDMKNIDLKYSDANVKNNAFYSDLYTDKLAVLKDAFTDVFNTRGEQYAKQFLYHLMTPRASVSEWATLNYDNVNSSYYGGPRFLSNKKNEVLVMRFLNAAMDGKVNGFSQSKAKEFFSDMMQAQKIAYLMTHDRSLAGSVFKLGNMDRGIDPTFNVIPTSEVKPKFLDAKVMNEQARKTMQSYLTGSYFLDPIELYRLTVGLDKSINQMPHAENIGEVVRQYWTDVGKQSKVINVNEGLGESVYRISRSPIENTMNRSREHLRRQSFSEKIWEEINCN